MPGIPELDTEAVERMADALGQPEAPAAEGAGVEPLRVGELENGMTPAPAMEVDGNLIVLKGVKNRLPAFVRCEAASSPKDSVVGDLRMLEMGASLLEFRYATARLNPTAVLGPVEGGEKLVIYMARPGKDQLFKEIVPDFMEDEMERRAELKDENGRPLAVVFGPKREKQAAAIPVGGVVTSSAEELEPPGPSAPEELPATERSANLFGLLTRARNLVVKLEADGKYPKAELAELGSNLAEIAEAAIAVAEAKEEINLGDRQLAPADLLRLVEQGRESYLKFLLNRIPE